MKDGKRDYRREYDKYQGREERINARVEQNKARRIMEREGKVSKGDGKDVDHKKPLSKGGSTSKSNLRVVDRSSNRSFSRNKDSSVKHQTSRRESAKRK